MREQFALHTIYKVVRNGLYYQILIIWSNKYDGRKVHSFQTVGACESNQIKKVATILNKMKAVTLPPFSPLPPLFLAFPERKSLHLLKASSELHRSPEQLQLMVCYRRKDNIIFFMAPFSLRNEIVPFLWT